MVIVTSCWTQFLWLIFLYLESCTETLCKSLRHFTIKDWAQSFPLYSCPFCFIWFNSVDKLVPSIGSMLARQNLPKISDLQSKHTVIILCTFQFTPRATILYSAISGSFRKSPVWQFMKNCWRHPTMSFSSHSLTVSRPSPSKSHVQSANVRLVYTVYHFILTLYTCLP